MTMKLILAIITITAALIFYTMGVFSERRSGTLQKKIQPERLLCPAWQKELDF